MHSSDAHRGCAAPPPPMSAVRIHGCSLRVLGHAADKLVIASTAPPFSLFLLPDKDGVPALVSFDLFERLRMEGAAETASTPAVPRTGGVEKLMVQLDMLQAAEVPLGTKAIAIWMHRNWSADLAARYGEPDSPHTLRRWLSRCRARPPN